VAALLVAVVVGLFVASASMALHYATPHTADVGRQGEPPLTTIHHYYGRLVLVRLFYKLCFWVHFHYKNDYNAVSGPSGAPDCRDYLRPGGL
jgi:hypothetical protein